MSRIISVPVQTITTNARSAAGTSVGAWFMFFLFSGVTSVALFHSDIYFPIWVSVALMALVVAYFIQQYQAKRVGLMVAVVLLVYLLPFIHIPSYLWYDFGGPTPILGFGGLAGNPYMFDQRIIELTAMLGATGALGIAFAVSLSRARIRRDTGLNPDGSLRSLRSLAIPMWLFWVFWGLLFSWISAPRETIFTAAYAISLAPTTGRGLDSAWMVSYILLGFAFIDALVDRNPATRLFKRNVFLVTAACVVIWLQLLRGDRESLPWVIGIGLVYFYWAAAYIQRKRKIVLNRSKIVLGIVLIMLLLIINMIVGSSRHALAGASLSSAANMLQTQIVNQLTAFEFLNGTWSGILLTPLSVAGDEVNGLLIIRWGKDYLDLLLSLPPGFVANIFGYARPIDALKGPAWEMRYGGGGTHATVLPFRNFLMIGVFLIPALWTYFLVGLEKTVVRKVTVPGVSLLLVLVMAAPHWLWYGEKNAMNALIIWGISAFFYKISVSLSSVHPRMPPERQSLNLVGRNQPAALVLSDAVNNDAVAE